ncbi:hypothetical protein U1Q18_037399 [Sarracenia purpurea var. burkii]
MDPEFAGKPIAALYSGRIDIDQMPDAPHRGTHRRAHSETFFRFPADILLDDIVPDFNLAALDLPSLSSDTEANVAPGNAPMAVDSSESDSPNGGDKSRRRSTGPASHFRTLSVGTDFFEGLDFASGGGDVESEGKPPPGSQQQNHYHRHRHRHSNSTDGSTSSFEADSSAILIGGVKKAMAPDRLAELALIDPKGARRILANRQSAARSKQRKTQHTNELETKVQTLQTEATTLSAQVTMLQRDNSELTAESKELKLRLHSMEQQAHLRDALNEAMREEVQRLKIETGQISATNGNPFNRILRRRFSPYNNNQTQHPQPQQQLPSFLDFNQRVQ